MSEVEFVRNALKEDLGRGDLFEKISGDKIVNARIVAKESGIFSGEKYAKILFEMVGIKAKFLRYDSIGFRANDTLMTLTGSYLTLLKIERVLLNILQHSSGIATLTRSFVEILESQKCATILLDTRKTRPNLRDLEKYSVRNGGARNHRLGLDDALMLKDTHLAHITDLRAFIARAREKIPFTCNIEVECGDTKACKIAMQSGANIVMCDNMSVSDIEKVREFRDAHYAGILLEASGNITRDNLALVAQTGVDAISVGALIHQAVWIDMSMKME